MEDVRTEGRQTVRIVRLSVKSRQCRHFYDSTVIKSDMMLPLKGEIDAKMLRKNAGLKLREVANCLGVSIRTVARWESGESP
jgi:DNA-binding transcriptional regulator YiaG